MGKKKAKIEQAESQPPKLARRRENRKSTFRLGRTIGAKREKLETANERQAARKKDKRKSLSRLLIAIVIFITLAAILVALFSSFIKNDEEAEIIFESENLTPSIEVIDEELGSASRITARMNLFIARAEKEFKALGLKPSKAVIPKGSIREVDFYIEDVSGFIKTVIDRNPAVTVEDADRMLRYLAEEGITEFTYIDVRIDGKAYWK